MFFKSVTSSWDWTQGFTCMMQVLYTELYLQPNNFFFHFNFIFFHFKSMSWFRLLAFCCCCGLKPVPSHWAVFPALQIFFETGITKLLISPGEAWTLKSSCLSFPALGFTFWWPVLYFYEGSAAKERDQIQHLPMGPWHTGKAQK